MAEKKPKKDIARIEQFLTQIGTFNKDTSGPMTLEERLNIANYNFHVVKEIVKELIKE